jgi:tetratricopeptide (TPR) repeat protein
MKRAAGVAMATAVVLASSWAQSSAQSSAQPSRTLDSAIVQGHVRDANNKPASNATVLLKSASDTGAGVTPQTTHADSQGAYRFAALPPGSYTLHSELAGSGEAAFGPLILAEKQTKTVNLLLGKTAAAVPEFFDEPQFTVAGVSQATSSGGHGSDTVLRTTEALAKATASLSKESSGSTSNAPPLGASEVSLRAIVAREPDNAAANRELAEILIDQGHDSEAISYLDRALQLAPKDPALHHLRGGVEETLGDPLAAVQEFQRAAELDPSELHLFDWGTELLTHRALEPATEVFSKGNQMFPGSVRMLIALSVSWYAREFYDRATDCLVRASELQPDNPTPYLFLGRMQSIGTTVSEKSVESLARFAQLQPSNAMANYYYALALQKSAATSADRQSERWARAESLLKTAVQLDPKLGVAYLQLGILYAQSADLQRAISSYQQAIEVSPEGINSQSDETLAESHYRLAQAYGRIGDRAHAKEELELHDRLAKKTQEDAERKRREVQQFVISLRNQRPAGPRN